jgi:hypothetical protein
MTPQTRLRILYPVIFAFQSLVAATFPQEILDLFGLARDRLSREGVYQTLRHLNRLESYGIGFRSFTEPYFDSCVRESSLLKVPSRHR